MFAYVEKEFELKEWQEELYRTTMADVWPQRRTTRRYKQRWSLLSCLQFLLGDAPFDPLLVVGGPYGVQMLSEGIRKNGECLTESHEVLLPFVAWMSALCMAIRERVASPSNGDWTKIPLEIHTHILECLAEDVDEDSDPTAIKRCALVSKTWSKVSQRLLNHKVQLKIPKGTKELLFKHPKAAQWLETAEACRASDRTMPTSILHLKGTTSKVGGNPKLIKSIMMASSHLKTLTLTNVVVQENTFGQLKLSGLKALVMRNVNIRSSSPSFVPSFSLDTLRLNSVNAPQRFFNSLLDCPLSTLQTLGTDDYSHLHRALQPGNSIRSVRTVLDVRNVQTLSNAPHLGTLRLKPVLLDTKAVESLTTILNNLPTSLRNLEIAFGKRDFGYGVEQKYIREMIKVIGKACLGDVEKVKFLNIRVEVGWEELKATRKECAERGVVVDWSSGSK